jgi:predicted flap endonuclease-1-like 5' DNA nuclease
MPAPATPPDAAAIEGTRPAGLSAPRGGKADDLKRIRGIGRQNEGRLHGLGIWHFDQIAAWNAEEAAWIGSYLAFPGRIEREDWIGQARLLAAGAETAFSKRVDAGEVATSRDDAGDDGQGNVEPPPGAPPAARKGGRARKPKA